MSAGLTFHLDRRPEVEAIRALYAAAPLRRPIHDPERIRRMFEGSNVVISAYDGERLVGLLRGWTDFAFDGYVCDLAIHPAYQHRGVGRRLLDLAQGLSKGVQWVLLASPIAKDYYAHVGWEKVENGWRLSRGGWSMPSIKAFQTEHTDLAAKA
ncbi:GNAT family N-acetyltransferase [Geothrix sp. PMB-07]|uniref:GNAT family N-acetyltransferase n=1 Tax=Geothrix sp. PMB-07 TaxID=3068640 RepID=UPI0027427CCB|nr:GNAT family N-acetyltransferase [Geothrix sp. PMB-07]WLT31052.1 GNAT family N-acetyltransferase [Geothrix sp. PMB-07]